MHTLNIDAARKHAADVGLSTPVPLTSGALASGGANTPFSLNTPDILNSLISITSNPFFDNDSPLTSSESPQMGTNASLPNGGEDDRKVFATLEAAPAGTPTGTTAPSLPSPENRTASVQSMRSQLIKDSLKLTIQTKRKSSGMCDLDLKSEETAAKSRKREELTPEDEERRKRRRERNKVAATKCRNKKKEKTSLLVLESETLEGSNASLKSEISKLELERRQLMEVLAAHEPVCNANTNKHNAPLPSVIAPSPSYKDYGRTTNGNNYILPHPVNNLNQQHQHHHNLNNNQNHYYVPGPSPNPNPHHHLQHLQHHHHHQLQSTATQL